MSRMNEEKNILCLRMETVLNVKLHNFVVPYLSQQSLDFVQISPQYVPNSNKKKAKIRCIEGAVTVDYSQYFDWNIAGHIIMCGQTQIWKHFH